MVKKKKRHKFFKFEIIKIKGYTDMCGRFDYAISSAIDIDNVEKFAVLVASEEHGTNFLSQIDI